MALCCGFPRWLNISTNPEEVVAHAPNKPQKTFALCVLGVSVVQFSFLTFSSNYYLTTSDASDIVFIKCARHCASANNPTFAMELGGRGVWKAVPDGEQALSVKGACLQGIPARCLSTLVLRRCFTSLSLNRSFSRSVVCYARLESSVWRWRVRRGISFVGWWPSREKRVRSWRSST
jgi:hypothetical protein